MDEVVAKYLWTADELVTAMRWHSRLIFRRCVVILVWGLIILFLTVGVIDLVVLREESGTIALAIGLFLLALHTIIEPWRIRRKFAQRPDQNIEIEWRFSSEIIRKSTVLGSSEVVWRAYTRIIQTPGGFLFYPNSQIFEWLPRHALTSEAEHERLSQLVQQNATKYVILN